MYYFAYGSNLDVSQMKERCPNAEPVDTAVMRDYALAFGGHSPNWDGAPATVVPDDGSRVPGLVYELPFEEIRVLDYYEGHPVRYERRRKPVLHRDSDESREVQIYIKEVDDSFTQPPASYLEVIEEAYRELDFDRRILERALALGAEDRETAVEETPQLATVGSD